MGDFVHDSQIHGGGSTTSAEYPLSRMSPGHVYRVMQSFTEYKKDLIRVIGFGGILELPNLMKLNLRFSKWLLSRVDCEKKAILVDDGWYIRFYDHDVEKMFGIPCGAREIFGADGAAPNAAVEFIRTALGMTDKDAHSLKKVEEFLRRDINESSSSLEQDSFQVAFVIFVMGHLLAPSTKHDYVAIDYWGALKSVSNISNYNWCGYVLRSVIESAKKFQAQKHSKVSPAVPGCHLLLQVNFKQCCT